MQHNQNSKNTHKKKERLRQHALAVRLRAVPGSFEEGVARRVGREFASHPPM